MTARSLSQDGFTLVEILIMMTILGVLAAIALPSFVGQTDKAKDAEARSNLNTAYKAARAYSTTLNNRYGSPSDTAAAIMASEPQLGSVGTVLSASGATDEGRIYVVKATNTGDLQLATRSESGQIYALSVTGNGAPKETIAPGYDYPQLVMSDAPSNYWPLNETSGTTAFNAAGTVNGTINGTVALGQPALMPGGRSSFDFSATASGRIGLPANSSLTAPTNFTMEAWVRLETTPNRSGGIYNMQRTSNANGAMIYIASDSRLRGIVYGGGSNAAVVAPVENALQVGATYHVVFVYDSGQLTLYQNGVRVAGPFNGPLYVPGPSVASYISYYGSSTSFQGRISDVALYNYGFDSDTVLSHYAAGCEC